MEDMKRTLNANRVCLPGSTEEPTTRSPRRAIAAAADTSATTPGATRSMSIPDIGRLGLGGPNDMLQSRLNAGAVSPRMEFQRLFGNVSPGR